MDDLERTVGAAARSEERWASVATVAQARENSDTPAESLAKWTKVYALFQATGESQQDEVFAAVNYYFLKNGCSPQGKYRKDVRTAGGLVASSGAIVKITGSLEGEVRQFMRGRLHDSYMFLKHNAAIKDDEELAAAAESQGVNREYSWLLADWLGLTCEFFVGPERSTYSALRSSKLALAKEKKVLAVPLADRVIESAPETKMSGRTVDHQNGLTDNGLF